MEWAVFGGGRWQLLSTQDDPLLPGLVRSSAPKSPEQGPSNQKLVRLTWISTNCEFPVIASF